jgi:hypothetical protein
VKTVLSAILAAAVGGVAAMSGLSIRYLLTGRHAPRFDGGSGPAVLAVAWTLGTFAVGALLSAGLVLRTVEAPSATGGWKASSVLALILLLALLALLLFGNL